MPSGLPWERTFRCRRQVSKVRTRKSLLSQSASAAGKAASIIKMMDVIGHTSAGCLAWHVMFATRSCFREHAGAGLLSRAADALAGAGFARPAPGHPQPAGTAGSVVAHPPQPPRPGID